VRAAVLGCLLPATHNSPADIDIFLKLMAMDDAAFGRRFSGNAADFAKLFPEYAHLVTEQERQREKADHPSPHEDDDKREEDPNRRTRRVWRSDLSENERQTLIAEAFATLSYAERLKTEYKVRRPEECDEVELLAPIWPEVNRHLGTHAHSLPELIEQLGIARFGQRPRVADTFCGGGSIPFEAARIGCDVYASDLNPIACMLTWGAFNVIGAGDEDRIAMGRAQRELAAVVDAEVIRLDIEHDGQGNRAKAYLYCLETRCPKTGWMVPMAPPG
jgi:putative DNA methylase